MIKDYSEVPLIGYEFPLSVMIKDYSEVTRITQKFRIYRSPYRLRVPRSSCDVTFLLAYNGKIQWNSYEFTTVDHMYAVYRRIEFRGYRGPQTTANCARRLELFCR